MSRYRVWSDECRRLFLGSCEDPLFLSVSEELCTRKPSRVQNMRAVWGPCRGLRRDEAARYIGISAIK